MPNPKGSNQFAKENPYGAVEKLTRLTKSAPMSGAPTPAMGAPKRAQRRAVRGGTKGDIPAPPPPPTTVPYATQLAQIWQEVRAHAPDDPLIAHYADLAQRQV
jgi:hypothetical protein